MNSLVRCFVQVRKCCGHRKRHTCDFRGRQALRCNLCSIRQNGGHCLERLFDHCRMKGGMGASYQALCTPRMYNHFGIYALFHQHKLLHQHPYCRTLHHQPGAHLHTRQRLSRYIELYRFGTSLDRTPTRLVRIPRRRMFDRQGRFHHTLLPTNALHLHTEVGSREKNNRWTC